MRKVKLTGVILEWRSFLCLKDRLVLIHTNSIFTEEKHVVNSPFHAMKILAFIQNFINCCKSINISHNT